MMGYSESDQDDNRDATMRQLKADLAAAREERDVRHNGWLALKAEYDRLADSYGHAQDTIEAGKQQEFAIADILGTALGHDGPRLSLPEGVIQLVRQRDDAREEIARLRQDVADYERSFDLYDKAIKRADKAWRDEKPGERELTLLGTAELVTWLHGHFDRLEAERNGVCVAHDSTPAIPCPPEYVQKRAALRLSQPKEQA